MVKFIKNPDQQSTDPLYRMPGRTTIVRNLKGLHVRLFETEETSIVTASEDREEVSYTSMTSRLSLLLDQSKIYNPVSDTFMKEVPLFAARGGNTATSLFSHNTANFCRNRTGIFSLWSIPYQATNQP